MSNKKIGFICPSKSWGGLEMNVFRLAIWLTERGFQIILFGHPESLLFEKFKNNNLKAYPVESKSAPVVKESVRQNIVRFRRDHCMHGPAIRMPNPRSGLLRGRLSAGTPHSTENLNMDWAAFAAQGR